MQHPEMAPSLASGPDRSPPRRERVETPRLHAEIVGCATRKSLARQARGAELLAPLIRADPAPRTLFFTLSGGGGARLRLTLGAGLHACAEDDAQAQRALFERVLAAQFPELILSTRPSAEHDAGRRDWRALRPAGRGAFRRAGRPKPRDLTEPAEPPTRLPAPGPNAARLRGLCRLLTGAPAPVAVKLALTYHTFAADELRLLADLRETLGAEPSSTELDRLLNLNAAFPEAHLASHFLREAGGVRLEAMVDSAAPLSEQEYGVYCEAVFGAPPRQREPEAFDGLDLSAVYPLQVIEALLTEAVIAAADEAFTLRPPLFDSRGATGARIGAWAGGEVRIGERDRARHVAIVGSTGSGKSTLMLNMIAEDMRAGKGVLLIDPHGDLYDAARRAVPEHRRADLVLADLGDPEHGFSLNLFEGLGWNRAIERNMVIDGMLRLFKRSLWPEVGEAFGPMFELYYRNGMMLVMETLGDDATLTALEQVFLNREARQAHLRDCTNEAVVRFWRGAADVSAGNDLSISNVAPYIVCKFAPFTSNPLLRPILGERRSTLDLPDIIHQRKICLINLAKGRVGGGSASLTGAFILLRLLMSVQAQARLPEAERRTLAVYLDEFQTYATELLAEAIEECRKFGMQLVLANQSFGQIDGRNHRPDLSGAILANIANLIAFRTGRGDAEILAPYLGEGVSTEELVHLRDYRAIGRFLSDGRPALPMVFDSAGPLDP